MIHRNFLKIVSVLMAIGLWFYVLNSESDVLEKQVALQYLLPQGKSFVLAPPYQVNLKLRGPKAFLRALMEREQSMLIDLKQSKPTPKNPHQYRIKLNESLLPLPLGVSIEKYEFKTLRLNLAKSVFKEVPIQLNLLGQVQENRKLVTSEVFPTKLKLQGAKIALNRLGKVQSRPIDLATLDGQGEHSLSFMDLPRHVQVVGDQAAVLRYKVVAQKINFTLDKVPIRFLSSRRILRSSHRKGTLFVFLDDETARLSRKQVQIIADIPEEARGLAKIKLQARLTNGAHLIRIVPSEITVTVK